MEGLDTRLTLNHFINVISDNFILENKYPKLKKKIQLPPEAKRNALLERIRMKNRQQAYEVVF